MLFFEYMADNLLSNSVICPHARIVHTKKYPYKTLKRVLGFRCLLDFEIFYMHEGSGVIHFKKKDVPIKQGGLYLIQPDILHGFSFSNGRISFIHFDLFYTPFRNRVFITSGGHETFSIEEQKLKQPGLEDFLGCKLETEAIPKQTNDISAKFNRALYLFNNHPRLWQLEMQGIIGDLVSLFLLKGDKTDNPYGLGVEEKLERAVMFIQGNLHVPLTLKEVARVAAVSPSYLSHMFKEKYGTGVICFHNKLRMEAIAAKLIQLNKSIGNIADEYGFDTPFNFSRRFKQFFKVSPKEYRRQHKAL
jgi:AraC-like DNA-binding protein